MAEEPVAQYPNLTERRGVFYLRMRVPLDLVPDLGRTHIVRSLKTKDRRLALGRYRIEQARAEREFEAARCQRAELSGTRRLLASGRLEKLAPAELEGIVVRWFDQAVQLVSPMADHRESHQPDWYAVLEDVKATKSLLESPNPDDHSEYIQNVTGQILLSAGAAPEPQSRGRLRLKVQQPRIDRDTAQYRQMEMLVRRGLIALNKHKIANLTGKAETEADAIFSKESKRVAAPARRTLEDLIRAFEQDPARSGRSQKTAIDYAMTATALREVIGAEASLSDITREDARRVRALFLSLPPNATKRFPGRTLIQVGELALKERLPPLRTKTVNEHVSKMAALFGWALREGWIDRNPATGLAIRTDKDSVDREPFALEQLQAIFIAPLFTGCQDGEHGYAKRGPNRPRRARFWVPLLSLFHGLRLNEACQLRPQDIAERNGIPAILVRAAEADQRVKSKAGTRVVPLHPEITTIGFLDFVDAARQSGAQRLFPELSQDTRGYFSDAFQKWFTRFLTSCGAARPNTTFHSFRHGWADRLREAGVPEDRRRALGGWADTGVDAGYGRGFPTKMLAADIALVTYPGLTLEHLHV